MKRDLVQLPKIESSFLSCEKDVETILRKLFVTSQPHSEQLKRLLVINAKDCLDNTESEVYKAKLKEMTLAKLKEDGYVTIEPKLRFHEHEEVKSYLIITFNEFTPNSTNPHFRDCTISFDILCNSDYWDLGNYRLRPFKIAGYIDGLLNDCKLSGIGKLNFMSCSEIFLDENLCGYNLSYRAIHGHDDNIPPVD